MEDVYTVINNDDRMWTTHFRTLEAALEACLFDWHTEIGRSEKLHQDFAADGEYDACLLTLNGGATVVYTILKGVLK